LNGKNIAKIKVEVGANRWKSYSSKFIQPNIHGEWKIELKNQAGGNLLSINLMTKLIDSGGQSQKA
jgi:hypothetical protein